ncbi:pilus assembly PilX N-terminal domain-containing protein [Candidatus Uhrbacteria bacterium]|nr:pilus assembly PilX N-terminal domain-containing protein [Candidatus Uhrbacteria bacterium]
MLRPSIRKGFALITVTIVVAILLGLSGYFVNLSITDMRIARAYAATTNAYYLAEAATAVFIYEVTHTNSFINRFRNGTMQENNSTLTYNDLLMDGDSIRVYAESAARGEATIFALASSPLDSVQATRQTATDISRALGQSITDYSVATGNNQDLDFRVDVTFEGGIVFANDDIDVENGATVTVNNGQVWAHDQIRVRSGSALVVNNGDELEDVPAIDLPAVDFDSADPTSWRSQATEIMTPSQFNQLPDNTTLNGIIFVTGTPQDLQKNLIVNGLLVINGSFELERPGNLTINESGGAAGLLVHSTLEIESNATIEGLVYAGNLLEIEFDDDDTNENFIVSITGGVMGREVLFDRDTAGAASITVTHDPDLIGRILAEDLNTTSPTIDVGHWEEQY